MMLIRVLKIATKINRRFLYEPTEIIMSARIRLTRLKIVKVCFKIIFMVLRSFMTKL